MKLVYLNVKPQKADEENPDNWKFIGSLGMSVAATYNAATKQLGIYEEKNVHLLIKRLMNSDLVVTFNGHEFDFKVLNAYIDHNLLDKKVVNQFNLLENIEGDLWQRLSLKNLAKQNLNRYQTQTAMHQIHLYQHNMMRSLRDAVSYDVKSIVKLFELGCKRKYLNYWCPDDWTLKSFRTDSWAKTCQKLTFATRNYKGRK